MSPKEQLLMNISEAKPIAEKMQALEGKSYSLEEKYLRNKVGLGFTVISFIMAYLVFLCLSGLHDGNVKEKDKILTITVLLIAAIISITFIKKVIFAITAKCSLAKCKRQLKKHRNNSRLSWIPPEKRTSSYILELSEYAKQQCGDPFKAILAEKDQSASQRKNSTYRPEANKPDIPESKHENVYHQPQYQATSGVQKVTTTYDEQSDNWQSTPYSESVNNRWNLSEDQVNKIFDDVFSKLDLPSISYSAKTDTEEKFETMTEEIRLSPDIKICDLVIEINALCEYCKTQNDGIPQTLMLQLAVMTNIIIEARKAYDFVMASTAVTEFKDKGKSYYGVRSLLDSVETYAAFIKCLTNGFDSKWLNELKAVNPQYSHTPEDLYEDEYQSISEAPLNNKTVKQVLSAMPNSYTVGNVQKIISAVNIIIDKYNIDRNDIVNSTYNILGEKETDGTVFTFTKVAL